MVMFWEQWYVIWGFFLSHWQSTNYAIVKWVSVRYGYAFLVLLKQQFICIFYEYSIDCLFLRDLQGPII